MEPGDTTSVFADVWPMIEPHREKLQGSQLLHVRATATCAGRHPTLSSRWKQRDEGTVGTRDECLAHIAVVWTDMRPASVRRALNG